MNGDMTKFEMIVRLTQRSPQLVAKDAEYAVKMILDAMTQAPGIAKWVTDMLDRAFQVAPRQ